LTEKQKEKPAFENLADHGKENELLFFELTCSNQINLKPCLRKE